VLFDVCVLFVDRERERERGGVQINYLIILGARLIAFSELRKAELKEREKW